MEEGDLICLKNRGNPKAEKNQKVSLMESVMRGRGRLTDITNTTTQQQRLARSVAVAKQENPNPVPSSNSKDYVAHLIKENTALLRLLGERNKIIELSGLELQKLRLALQKAHQQNWQLAQANSQMLAELNVGKDKLKALQHELGCTVAVLKAKNFQLEEKEKLNKQLCDKISTTERPTNCAEVAIDPPHQTSNKKPSNPNRKRTSRYHSLGSSTVTHQVAAKEKDDNRRKSLRRHSGNFRSQPCEPTEDLFEIEDAKFPVSSLLTDPMNEDHPIQLDSSAAAASSSSSIAKPDKEQDKDGSGSSHYQNQELRRSSVGRPLRMAKVGVSYKETPLNVKMRRQ